MRPQSQSVSAPAPVTLSPTSLSFGSQTVGTTSAASVKLTNNQATALTISTIVASGDFAVVQNSTCGASLASGKSCAINVTFTPSAIGARSGALTITDSAAGSPQVVPLNGAGVVNLSLSSGSLSFGNQDVGTTSAIKTVSLTNSSSIPIAVSGVVITGDFTQTNTCGGNLAASSSCLFSVKFAPTAAGTRNGTSQSPTRPRIAPRWSP